ncbi:choice-of-anchor Q domain-containing protein [Gimesia aquarii]|uniref:Probable pectate lyase C n=1 Tax=Gimesia aquarii TaxID=2527964 RepID=A0A517WRI1_9PLAN|nr:choice-of-anchor Q domain-containing protein [Gimesia aquarii]QDU07870.1 putative outer membrane protein PmpB precursor [Gimesia aquarii]
MLLTSWVESMRVAFEKSRKATLNPRRRLQLRSVPSSARQKIQRKVAIEQLEDRTLLTSLIINQLTPGLGVTLDNSVLDPDADGVSNFDSIIFEDLTFDATSGAGVSIDLDNLTFSDPFTILFDNVSISSTAGVGIDIELSNLLVDTIAVDSSTITGGVGNAFNVDLTNVTLNEFNVIDSTLSGQLGAGITAAVNASVVEETSVRRSTIDGVSIDVTNGSVLRHTTMADNTISGTSGDDGVSVNIIDSLAEELRLTNNNSIQGVAINVDDTAAGGAALLTELFLHSNIITGNTVGDGVRIDLNNVDLFASITENSITANSGHGIVFDQTDGDLSGDISDNVIANNTGHGIFFTPTTTNPPPTGDGAPGVPPFAGVPGPTDKIDFAAPRNEVQLISFAGNPSGGTYTISYTGGNGITETTAGILSTATAAQVKAAMVAAFSEIGVGDILINGNFQDGFEVEFVNSLSGMNVNPFTVDTSGFTGFPASVTITASTVGNQSEIQNLEVLDVFGNPAIPTFGTFQLTFFGQTVTLPFTDADPTNPNAEINIAAALNFIANSLGFTGTPIDVVSTGTGFDIIFLDSGTLHDFDIPPITVDAAGLRLFVNVVQGPPEVNPNKPPSQTILFQDVFGNTVTPTGGSFRLTFQGETTGDIAVDPDPAITAANIDAALQALPSATTRTGIEGDFIVTGDFTNGFVVEFNEIQHLAIIGSNLPTFGSFQLTFLGQSVTLPFSAAIANPASAATIELALNQIASNLGFGLNPVSVVVNGNGFDVIFLDSGTLANVDIPQITTDASGLRFDVVITEFTTGAGNTDEQQLLRFVDSSGLAFPFTFDVNGTDIIDAPAGPSFTLTFQGETTAGITIGATPAETITNIENALEALPSAVDPDSFIVTGNFTAGFLITFQGDFAALNVPLIQANVFPVDVEPSTRLGNFVIDNVNLITGDVLSGPLEPFVDVVPSTTQDGIGVNEVQTISIPNNPGGGTFTLDFRNSTTGPVTLPHNATAAEVQAALESLDEINVGDVSVTGSVATGGFDVEFIGTFRADSPGDLIVIDDTGILIVVPTVTTVTEGTTQNEVQEVVINGAPTGGDFTLTFDGATTGPIAFNADAAAIIAALQALSTIAPGEVMVRGDAVNGFEIEFVGSFTSVNTPQITADATGLTGGTTPSITTKTTSVGGFLRGIRGNTITGNSGAGVEIDLAMFTSFYGDISGNTISSNEAVGVKLTAADTTILHSIDFSLSVDGNTMNDNRGAGIVVFLQDTATGDVSITNNTITESRNDNDTTTPFAGAAIYVHLLGTDVSFEAFSQLRDLTIDGNFIGTDAANTGGLGNVQNGITIHIEESTIIDRTQISNNVISNNSGDGIFFHREDDARVGRAIVDPIVGEERAVMIYSNTISGNSDGIDILAQNGSLTTTDFEIKDNIISSNIRDGISLHAEADATIFADIIHNQITLNSLNGVESTTRTTSYFGTDRRDVAGTWIQNDISNNTQHGVRISGRIGNRVETVNDVPINPHFLFIGLNGVDPVTGMNRGNVIEGNGLDGIQIAAHLDRVQGNVKIANNSILSNATGGIELLGESLSSSIDNNLIAFNNGKGVDINSNGQTVFLRDNIITENTLDGLEFLNAVFITHSENNITTSRGIGGAISSLTAIGNFIDNNGGRGVDLQTEENANSDFIFGDGTEKGANRIVSNALEGFYVVTTASRGQNQDADSTAALDATGSVNGTTTDMVLQLDTNFIQDNGVNSNFTTTGLILRIGTAASSTSFTSQTPGSTASVGDEDSSNFGNGRSNVSITNNEFEGNFGEDFYVESFTSTVDPPTTASNWDIANNPQFRVTGGYRRDPLARLNLVFEGNTGNGLNVTNVGAFYNNAEPVFKSRLNNGAPAPNPDGPFSSATRRRNAQRVASRTNLAPFSAPNPAPTAVGTVADAFLLFPGGPINITTTTAHGLTSGATVEITDVFSDELGFFNNSLSAANGVFVIDVIDALNFSLRSTEGAVLGNVFQNFGTWSSNDNGAFLYDGMGVSTFRIAQGFDGVDGSGIGSGGFQQGDSFLFEANRPGTIFGELNFDWDIWTPDADTFLAPVTSTFLTADISVAVPDPTSGAITDPLIISFTEDVNGVDISDFVLLRNNVVVALNAGMLTQIDARTFELDLSSVTGIEGEYDLRLLTDGSISDAKYVDPFSPLFGNIPSNFLSFGDVERFIVDTTDPVADIVDVSPDPRSDAAGEVVVNFTEDVTGVDLSDFSISIDGGPVVLLSTTPATLRQVTGSQFVLDLSKVTSLSGDYTLTLNAAGSSITDLAGNALAADAVDMWVNDTLAPIAQFENVTDPVPSGTDPTFTVVLNFSENVTGLALSDFTLNDGSGPVNLSTTTAVINQITPARYEIVLGTLADANAIYTITYNAGGSAVQDASGNDVAGSTSESWQKGTEVIAPTAGIQDITPDPRPSGDAVGIVTINFSEEVTGVDITDFELLFDDGSGQTSVAIGALLVTSLNASTYQIDLSTVTGIDGDYTLNLLADGSIQDLAGNTFATPTSDSWRTGGSGPVATIEDLPDVLLTNAGVVNVTFNQAVTGVDITDFRLTLNGQDVSLAGLTVNPISGTEYSIDLSSVTNVFGNYELTLVAAGSNIRNISSDPVLNNSSESWVTSSTIDLNLPSPVLTDGVDSVAGDGVIGNGTAGTQTLRAAIQEANALAGSNTIELAAGTYVLSIAGIDEDVSATGDLDIRDNLTIRGQGVAVYDVDGNLISGTVIDAGALDRIFQVFAGVTLNLENLTITNGALTGSADGAGIRNSGTTTLTNVEVTGNVAEDSAGGLNNTGLMIIVDSTISNNTAGGSGGGIRNTGTLQVSRSTISGNSTERDGGAIFNAGVGIVTLDNSTFSGNLSDRSGGAIRNTATLNATNNTFTLNGAGTDGGAISNTGTSTLQNNLIIGNTGAVGAELQGDYVSLGGNLTGLLGTATGFGAFDIVDVLDPTTVLDSTLADNGGPTLTHALILGSIAIDAGAVDTTNVAALEQRGTSRILGTNVDIGAVEFGTFFVNSFLDTVDETPGDGIAADVDGNLTLRAAIMEANALTGDSLIVLESGTYYLNILNMEGLPLDDAATGDLDITDTTGSLRIVGAGNGQTIISAAQDPSDVDAISGLDDRVFDVLSGADLTLDSLTVTGGTAINGSGGGIRNIGTVSLLNAAVDGNTADVNGGGILNGLLDQQGTLNLTNSFVSNNSAVDGAGIFNNDQSQVTIIDSEVTNNTASNDGGGIFNDLQATIDITRSTISGNTATLDGGGIYNNDLANLTLNDSKVNNNTADQGAGLFNEEAASLTVNRTTVSGNNALLHGGGIYNDEGVVTLSDVSILTNTANSDGGGFYNASAGDVTISNSFFDDNTANRDGGAIANFGVSLSITGTTIRDSEALRNGGGLFNDQEEGTVSLVSTTLINNEAVAGGGIYNQELGNITLDLSNVMHNLSSTNGAGIFNTADATLTVQRTTIDGNVAANDGAGIYNEENAQLNLFSSTVSNNIATRFGGGVYNNSITLADIVNATISGNEASSGGGIYNDEEGSMEVTNATIFNNSAITGGGILNATDGFVSVANTIVAGNFSVSPGPDVSGDFVSRGNNLIGVEGISTGFTDGVNGDQVGSFATPVSPGLGGLQDNGGATFTHELLGGSLARDAGNNFFAPTDDQRGFARLFDGDGNGSLIVDIGAFESGYIVTAFGDSVDADPGDGVSVDINGQSTLRAAINEANARSGADTILLGAGVYTLSLFGQGEDNGLWGDLDITDDLTIIGAGSGRTIIDADFLDRIFHILTGINVSIRGVTLVNGDVTRVEDGGAILNYGNLTLEDVEIRNSLANRGGALFNNGVVTITESEFIQNTAIAGGGAIFNTNGGTVTLTMSNISNNNAENGGAIYNTLTGTLEIIDTTLDSNTATIAGGAIYNSSELTVGNGEGGDDSGDPPPPPPPPPVPEFTIDVVFTDSSLSASQQAIFQQAADRWSEIIIADVPDVVIAGIGLVDDLRIEATAPFIDGVGGILGSAGPRALRTGSFIPATGVMRFDSADLANLEASGQLIDVILHEMGHVLGIGTIWERLGLVIDLDTQDPRFVGTEAITQYNALLGRNVVDIPVANTGGPGTFGSHWRESDLTNELMTGFLNSGVANPISTITIGSLADLGYVVDLNAADTFPLQAPAVNLIPLGEMLDVDPFIVLDESAFVSVEAGAGTVTIANSTVSNNFAGTRGGGLLNEDPMSISNVTFSGNEAGKEGGAIHNTGELTINNTTIYDNFTEGSGGGIYSVADTATVNVKNTIVGGNNAFVSGSDVQGTFNSQGNNLIGTNGSSTGFIDGFNNDIVGSEAQRIDPALSPLQDNGGPTLTHALLVGSLAIDAGDNTDGVVTDQRGAARPTDTTSDIGAFEIVTPSISIADISQVETNSGTTVFEILVSLSNVNVDEVTVDFETSNGSAIAGIDYEFTTGTVTFSPGETTQIIEVIVNGDTLVEDNETFFVNLFDAVGALIVDNQSLGTILNDEAEISISDVTKLEGPVGTTANFDFTVSLAYPVAGIVTVDLRTLDGSATLADSDYSELPLQTITFNPGETSKTVTVVVNGDSNIEGDETFQVELSNATNTVGDATILTPTGTGTIENDDKALLSISDVTLTEDFGGATTSFNFTVSLSQGTSSTVTVDVATMDGTATVLGNDYLAASQTLTFNPFVTEQTFTVTVNSDALTGEGNETFFVNLSSAVNANIADGQGLGTIVEDGIVVTTFDDIVDSSDPFTSLREAITEANNTPGTDNIILLPGTYDISIVGVGEDGNATGDFDILDDVNIFGQGSNSTIIDANGLDRIFHTDFGVELNLSNMQLINGDADNGGALFAQGPTTINQLIFRDNNSDFLGGAIVSGDQIDISDTQFLNNHAGFQGGAIYQFQDTATISRSIFTDNTSDGRAGAVYVASGATLDVSASLFNQNDAGSRGGAVYNEGITTLTNTTFSANHSGSRGGAIFNDGDLNVLNNTITLNTADQSGGGISNESALNPSAVVELVNTIVAGNSGALGNDDLDGDYVNATSFNNLIGNIGSATGLTDGDNGNIVGSLIAPVDPNLGILLDNGGPTKTHSLLFGSLAIDTGRNNGAPLVDQRGLTRPVAGTLGGADITDIGAVELQAPLPAPLFGTGGDSDVAEEQTNIQISVVTERTVVSSDGHTFALPANEDWIHEWESFWVEVWVDTASGFGITDVLTNLVYNTAYFTATSFEFGSNFAFNRTIEIDDEAGIVRNLGGSTIESNVGGTGHALLARIKFEALAGDQVEVDPDASNFGPLQLGLDVVDTEIDVAGVGEVTANVGALPETDLYPVIYDINDDDAINFRDLMIFASTYSQEVYSSSSAFAAAMDFDKSGQVNFKDLTYLASNYNKSKSGNTQVNFPLNFGQKWIGTSLDVVSGDDNIDQVVEAAVDTWETALGLEEPLEVQVIVRDFGTAQLGSGQTTEISADGIPVAGRVVIDDDANGLGWHVDSTELPPGGGYDLYTVLLHEIGHVLGFTRYYSGFGDHVETDNNGDLVFVGSDFTVALDSAGLHIEDPSFPDDLMNATLDPGVRKTPSAINIQMLLESYASAQSGASNNGGANPLMGTNVSPAAVANPIVIQSPEAAQTFVEESTVGFVAPAAIKTTEEDHSLNSVQQLMTFDVIQPPLFELSIAKDGIEIDGSAFEDLYSESDFDDSLTGAEPDDRQLVFAHSANDSEFDLTDDFDDDLESMDDAFTNWEGPLL